MTVYMQKYQLSQPKAKNYYGFLIAIYDDNKTNTTFTRNI